MSQPDTYAVLWPRVRGWAMHTRASLVSPEREPSLVMVHGLGVSARYLLPTFDRLAPFYNVLAPELPGFGLSDRPPHALGVPELADVLAEWMDHMKLPRAALLGNSLGCQVIVDLAVRYPERVESLVLVAPTVDTRDHTMPRQLWRGFKDLLGEPWSLRAIIARDYLRTGTVRMYQTFRHALDDRIDEKISRVRARTLIVRGSRDPVAPRRWVEELAALAPHARVVEIEGGTHATNYTRPEALARVTARFLEGREVTDSPGAVRSGYQQKSSPRLMP
ncbi:MAG TPA: alpha/beta hydrolase [Pirellulales bacterium]|jgi:2-hydroxy-6-oxonona-2,4-dienedioate hydrolase|nr:alpha/beta hydrolase [Pirellulales bacterium]